MTKKGLIITLIITVFLTILLSIFTYHLKSKNDLINNYIHHLFLSNMDAYSSKKWFKNFKEALINQNVLPTKIIDSELTPDEKYLLILLSDGYSCNPLTVYRFNTQKGILNLAQIKDNKEACSGPRGQFSRLFNNQTDEILIWNGNGGCEITHFFQYDFDKNIITPQKESSFCEGDQFPTVTSTNIFLNPFPKFNNHKHNRLTSKYLTFRKHTLLP